MNNKKLLNLLQYVSDLHLEKKYTRRIYAKNPYLILVGDIGYPNDDSYKKFIYENSYNFDKVFVISGNHEYDKFNNIEEAEMKIKEICSVKNNTFFIQKDTHLLCKEDNIYLAGCTLWSEFPKSKSKYHKEHISWISDLIKKNSDNNYILATHHCPLLQCLSTRSFINFLPKYFASDQSNIINKDNVLMWIHGHSHINSDFLFSNKLIVSNQYGIFKHPMKNYRE